MATRLTKKQQGELTEKLTGIIQKNNALQLRMSADRSVNEMNVNQISSVLNRIHGQAIGKDMPTEINIPVKQLGSGDPSPDNVRPIVGYEVDGIGTIYGGELNIETGVLTVTYGNVDLGSLNWNYNAASRKFYVSQFAPAKGALNQTTKANIFCSAYETSTDARSNSANYDKIIALSMRGSNGVIISVRDSDYTIIDVFKQAVSGVFLVYELETPETYTLTPQQMLQLLDQL